MLTLSVIFGSALASSRACTTSTCPFCVASMRAVSPFCTNTTTQCYVHVTTWFCACTCTDLVVHICFCSCCEKLHHSLQVASHHQSCSSFLYKRDCCSKYLCYHKNQVLTLFLISSCVPEWVKSFTTAEWPSSQAQRSGVQPRCGNTLHLV